MPKQWKNVEKFLFIYLEKLRCLFSTIDTYILLKYIKRSK